MKIKPICIIPARSGSKRIKNKNIQMVNGHPLIGLAIRIAKKANIFSQIVVSTDCEKIASISKKYGAQIFFLRSKKLSDDFTPTYKVLIDCVKKIKSENSQYHFCLYPTSVLINTNDLVIALKKIKKTNSNFLCTIAKFENYPQRSIVIKKNFISFHWAKYQLYRSQDLDDLYYDTGSFYIYKTDTLMKMNSKRILPKKSTYIVMKKKVIDINYPKDLKDLKKVLSKKKV
tara:strand:- start:16422 stop:17111 length:690 start_codon:yes stop_codon:yes gene_type:complete